MKRMLINATQAEELRVAVVDGQKLLELEIEFSLRPEKKGNIYKGVITRVEPSLDAVFVDYGEERHGFLPFKEIARQFFKEGADPYRARVSDAMEVGQSLIVQVEKDERGNKGAALSTFISLAGRYTVLMPANPRAGGVSRRADANLRNEMRETLDQLSVPEGMGLIIRTAGVGRDLQDLNWDLDYLKQLWQAISTAASALNDPGLIYQESNLVIRAIRDYFQPEIHEILIDTQEIYDQASQFMGYVMPSFANRVKLYADHTPLFSRFQVEHQIETAYSRTVTLPSGGSIVIDRTEALVAIDINSSKSTRGQDVEQTALTTNLEAAEEIARQLRLRDLGGLIVIDFIDMESNAHQREVENKIRESLRYDRARIQMQRLSKFGLMEISRQRLHPALGESSNVVCPRCAGAGSIRSTDSFALQALREIEDEAIKENSGQIRIQVPVEVASFLLNEKRTDLQRIEIRTGASIMVIPNKYLETPHYHIERLRHDELNEITEIKNSYQHAEDFKPTEEIDTRLNKSVSKQQVPVVKGILPSQPAPTIAPKTQESESGLWTWIKSLFAPPATPEKKPVRTDPPRAERAPRRDGRPQQDRAERHRPDRKEASRDLARNDSRDRNKTPREERPDRAEDRNDRPPERAATPRPNARPTERSERPEARPAERPAERFAERQNPPNDNESRPRREPRQPSNPEAINKKTETEDRQESRPTPRQDGRQDGRGDGRRRARQFGRGNRDRDFRRDNEESSAPPRHTASFAENAEPSANAPTPLSNAPSQPMVDRPINDGAISSPPLPPASPMIATPLVVAEASPVVQEKSPSPAEKPIEPIVLPAHLQMVETTTVANPITFNTPKLGREVSETDIKPTSVTLQQVETHLH